MTQVAFSSFLMAMLLVPVVALILRRWTKARALPPVLLLGSLVVGTAVAAAGFWQRPRIPPDGASSGIRRRFRTALNRREC